VSPAARRWIEAAKRLAEDPTAVVRCPERDDGVLLVRDVRTTVDPTRGERYLVCETCGAQNVMLMRMPPEKLNDHLQQLFALVAGGPGRPPIPTSILIAELKPDDLDGGRTRVREERLQTPEQYEVRFAELLDSGFAWVNLNYCGLLRENALVLIEHPRSPSSATGPTSVNYSGPPKLVADAGWNALAYVSLTARAEQ
jgi:hypothetical protein